MANVSGQGTIHNLPNYVGELFTADHEMTPFLSTIGGMSGGKQTQSREFVCSSYYEHETAAQPALTETQSLAALSTPGAIEFVRAQIYNTTQIFMRAIQVSYVKLSNAGLLSGLNIAGQSNPVADERAFQIQKHLIGIARDIEYSFLQGAYQAASNATTAAKTRGINEACSTGDVNGASGYLTKALIDTLVKDMADGGAKFGKMMAFVNSFQKQKISDIYGFVPPSRTEGGLNVQKIYTDFCEIDVVFDPFNATTEFTLVDVSACAPVFQPVPGKGNFFYEELSKDGASENGMLFGQIGLDYGAEWMHGHIYDLLDA